MKGFYAPQWFGWRRASSCFFFIFLVNPAFAQLSSLENAEELFAKRKYSDALEQYQEIEKNSFAPPIDIALAQCRIGVIFSIQNSQGQAKNYLERAIKSGVIPRRHLGVCQYALLQIYAIENNNKEAVELIKKMDQPELKPLYMARIYAIGVEVSKKTNDNKANFLFLQKLAAIMEQENLAEIEIKIYGNRKLSLKEIKEKLGLSTPSVVKTPKAVRTPVPTDIPLKSPIITPIETALKETKSPKNSEERISNATGIDKNLESLGFSISSAKINTRNSRLANDDPRNMRVGIILPVGSFFTKFNSRILRAISAFTASPALNGVEFSFYVKATASDVGAAEKAAVDLIIDEHVHAIIGPISNSQTLGVSGIASIFTVPVFALGPVVNASEFSFDGLIRLGLLAKSQAQALILSAKGDSGMRNISILSPDDAYGYEMARAMELAAKESSLPVVKTLFYSAATEQFREPVQASIGSQPEAQSRKEEYDALVEEAKKKAQEDKRHFDPKSILLPPILPFDCLFIPESLNKSRVIASTFAFFGATKVKYLGDKQWSEGAIGKKSIADPFMLGSRVVVPAQGSFSAFLKKQLDISEGSLELERQAFDALMFLRTAQYKTGGNNPHKIIDAMHDNNWSVDGISVYGAVDSTGEPNTKQILQSYQNGKLSNDLLAWKIDEEK